MLIYLSLKSHVWQ